MTRKELFGAMVGHVTDFTATPGNGQVTLKWTDPEDSVYEEVALPWAGTRIVRKEGGFPENENDGVIVVDSTIRNQYSENGFKDSGLVNGTKYFYQAFPYTVIYNLDEANRIDVTVGDAFITTWSMVKGMFTLPTKMGYKFTAIIDWGDGTIPTEYTNIEPTHKYEAAGTYRISITGTYPGLYINRGANSCHKIISVDSWGNVGFKDFLLAYAGCDNLTSLPNGPIPITNNILSFASCFYECTSLKTIPHGIFDNCGTVASFSYCFFNCTALNSIPNDLFKYCLSVTDYTACFYQCNNLQLPETIFDMEALKEKNPAMPYTFRPQYPNSFTGTAQPIWENVSYGHQCFLYDTALTNYAEIPASWK